MSSNTLATRIPRGDHVQGDERQPPHANGEVADQKLVTLVPLKTVLELRAEHAVIDVYITAVPVKSVNPVISELRSLLSDAEGPDLQHLRRVVKPCDLPPFVSARFLKECCDQPLAPGQLYLMVGAVGSMRLNVLNGLLSSVLALTQDENAPIWTTAVPLLPPTSQDKASQWSLSHWPTIYKKHNPFGPHPAIVSRAEVDLCKDLDNTIAMAHRIATATATSGLGEPIGAVIMFRSNGFSRAIALAGDARWAGGKEKGPGNVMAHAALRAIGMVAQRLAAAEHETAATTPSSFDTIESGQFLDKPMLPGETEVFEGEALPPGGYLCHNLEIYLTHEPCVMCSMALLHSRFGKVVFGKRMPLTGGLCGETGTTKYEEKIGLGNSGLGHGLFWRKELNWSFLAWEAPDRMQDSCSEVKASIQV